MTVTDLLPCPFCGGDAVTENLILEGVVRCSGCCAKIIRKHEVKEDTGQAEAIAAWNTRAPDPAEYERKVAQMKEDFPNGI